jgi:hypothetical protein
MALSTYSELQTAIAGELVRDDLTAKIPDWIRQCEVNVNRDLDHFRAGTLEDLALSAGDDSVALPSDYVLAKTAVLQTSPLATLDVKTLSDLYNDYPNSTQGQPEAFAVHGTTLYFRPVADSSYTLRLYYTAALEALSDSNTSNWLLASYPDVYLYGSLVWSAPYLQEDGRLQTWLGLYDRAIGALRGEDARSRYSGGPIRASLSFTAT